MLHLVVLTMVHIYSLYKPADQIHTAHTTCVHGYTVRGRLCMCIAPVGAQANSLGFVKVAAAVLCAPASDSHYTMCLLAVTVAVAVQL